jgi:twitching motility protein PilT
MEMVDVLKAAAAAGASDVHLVIGRPPLMRVNGEILEIPSFSKINAEESKRMIYSILYEEQRAKFEEHWELDCSFNVTGLSRFRVNVLLQKNGVEAVLRLVNSKIPTPEQLRFSKSITDLADLPRGLVLVTGPTGSGKSTTLAAIIEMINQKYTDHILTIEDPIEFVYESKKAIFRQREVGASTKSFTAALRSALRQDPDIVLVGELRDLETIQLAITAAETGHLCFGTLHTQDAPSTIDRIIDVFPPHQQAQIRVQLAVVLQAVVCQQLVPRKDGEGRIAAREIMIMNPAIANLIREGKTHMLYQALDTGAKHGMIPMDKSLSELVRTGLITPEEALVRANNPETFKQLAGITGRSSASLM